MSQTLRDQLLAKAKSTSQQIHAVFDLDSTLFNVRHRTEAILRAFADVPEMLLQYPDECRDLADIRTLDRDWGIRQALERSGIRSSIQFFECVRSHWVKHFFSSDWLHIDQPYPGAIEFVHGLQKAGTQISYLTGRDEPRMGRGTRASLEQWSLPLDLLVMKPDQSLNDAQFKTEALCQMAADSSEEIWFFENEPLIIEMVRQQCPDVEIYFVDTTHSGRAKPPTDLPKIIWEPADEDRPVPE